MTTTATRERPINLREWEVRAIRRGMKTQLRLPVSGVPETGPNSGAPIREIVPSLLANSHGDLWDVRYDDDNPRAVRCPFGATGNRLWAREPFARNGFDVGERVYYRADGASQFMGEMRESNGNVTRYFTDRWEKNGERRSGSDWNPATRMPRWASRLTLEVESVRVQRLHALTDADAASECAEQYIDSLDGRAWDIAVERWCRNTKIVTPDAFKASQKGAFVLTWDRRFRDTPWKCNPWVWALTFKVVTP